MAGAAVATPAAAQYSPTKRYVAPDGADAVRQRGPCNDPWVTVALELVYGSADPALCAPALYRGGNWGSSFNDLVHAVAATRTALANASATLRVVPVRGASYSMVGIFSGGTLVAAGGGNLVAAGGGNLVAAGGGNIVLLSGGQLVAAGGGNLVSPGGSNLAPTASVGSSYSLQSARSKISLPVGGIAIQ